MLDNNPIFSLQLTVQSTGSLCVGTVNITLSDSNKIGVTLAKGNSMAQTDGTILYTTLYTNAQPLGNITSAEATPTLPLVPLTCVPLKIQINYMSNLVDR